VSALDVVMFIGGLALLLAGAEVLVRGASALARAFGVSPLVVGLTVVAFGTSSPELAIGVASSVSGQGALALGNVVGSNIANVLLILGIAAIVAPIAVTRNIIRGDVPVMIGMSALVLLLALDGKIARWEGVLLLVIAVVYTGLLIRQSKKSAPSVSDDGDAAHERSWKNVALVVAGLAMLVLGSKFLVTGATSFARAMGLSELVIGLTVVAVGTSAPEIATTVTAALRGQREIAIGGVIGSNIYNVLLVLGIAVVCSPTDLAVPAAALYFDIPVMVAVSLACLPIFFVGYKVMRWEGALFVGYYVAYVAYLILAAQHHRSLPMFSTVMLGFVIPLTAVTLLALTLQSWRRYRRDGHPEH
jgi:cation:H+ antiporter